MWTPKIHPFLSFQRWTDGAWVAPKILNRPYYGVLSVSNKPALTVHRLGSCNHCHHYCNHHDNHADQVTPSSGTAHHTFFPAPPPLIPVTIIIIIIIKISRCLALPPHIPSLLSWRPTALPHHQGIVNALLSKINCYKHLFDLIQWAALARLPMDVDHSLAGDYYPSLRVPVPEGPVCCKRRLVSDRQNRIVGLGKTF